MGNASFLPAFSSNPARLGVLCALAIMGTNTAAAGILNLWNGPGANDSVDWAQLGPYGTFVPQSFNVRTSAGYNISGALGGAFAIMIPQCGVAICVEAGFPPGDMLMETISPPPSGVPPLTLMFPAPVAAGGLLILPNFGPGLFTAQIRAFSGTALLGSANVVGANSRGRPPFLGIQDTTAEITSLQFSLTSCPSSCSDFFVDRLEIVEVPELCSMVLVGSALIALRRGAASGRRARASFPALPGRTDARVERMGTRRLPH